MSDTTSSQLPDDLSVLIVDPVADRRHLIEAGLPDHVRTLAIGRFDTGELLAIMASFKPDIVLLSFSETDDALVELIRQITETHFIAIAVFTERTQSERARELIRLGASSYIVDGLKSSRIMPVIEVSLERFRLLRGLQDELVRSQETLAARKLIERAKGLLMSERGLSEQDAYARMRQLAMSQSRTLKSVAESIIAVSPSPKPAP